MPKPRMLSSVPSGSSCEQPAGSTGADGEALTTVDVLAAATLGVGATVGAAALLLSLTTGVGRIGFAFDVHAVAPTATARLARPATARQLRTPMAAG
jgi:hypothetical protein